MIESGDITDLEGNLVEIHTKKNGLQYVGVIIKGTHNYAIKLQPAVYVGLMKGDYPSSGFDNYLKENIPKNRIAYIDQDSIEFVIESTYELSDSVTKHLV